MKGPYKERASEKVAEAIRQLVVDEGMGPGTMLPSIERLSERFNVSKGTVREALQTLAAAGLVDMQQGRGTSVSRPSLSNLIKSVSWRTAVDGTNVSELMEARIAVETMTARLAAERATKEELNALGGLVAEMRAAVAECNYDRFIELDAAFHSLVARASRNRPLADFVAILRDLLNFTVERDRLVSLAHTATIAHEEIADAIRRRDPEKASEFTIRHIEQLEKIEDKKGVVIYCDVLGTGSIGGSFYTMGQGVARLIGRYTWIKPAVQVTGGGVENVRLAQDRRIVLGITQADVAFDAYHGRGEFEFAHTDLRALCCLHGSELQISTLESSGIRSLEDLRGRTVAVGAYGGASARVAREVLSRCGLEPYVDYTPQMHPFATAVDMLRRRLVDAVFFLSVGQSAALIELAMQEPLHLISLEESLVKELESEHPYWYRSSIQAHTYPGQDEDVRTIGVPTVLVTHKDLPDSDAYAVTSVILDRSEEIGAMVSPPRAFTLQVASFDVGIPRHPGAARCLASRSGTKGEERLWTLGSRPVS